MSDNESLPDVSGMVVFARVVEEGSFTAAARRLGRSKASVSREIAALEERLGAQLIRRTTRRMSLTEVGDLFFERCRRVVEVAEDAERSVHQLQAEPHGTLRVAVSMDFGAQVIAPRIHRFMARYASLKVEIQATDRVIDLVHERLDLAVRIRRPRELSYVMRRICPIRGLICASPAYVAQYGEPERPEDLLERECLTHRPPTETWKFSTGEVLDVSGRLTFDNHDALRRAALQGLGIATIPTHMIGDDVRAGRLVPVLLGHTHPGTWCHAVYPESRHLSPKVRAMIDWLVEELGPEPEWDRDLPVPGRA
ncbi:MAG: LysR family transcriptional regulator [Deltaproteobacteria bacterium]|jgi:DNA-binding transcriptional LysR family regulator|nr:LysR family transcriptional regulator [Deltaproteobacteria bacterium]